jgi:adhesin/invasin
MQVSPGPVHSLNLSVNYPFALADGYSTVKAMSLVTDDYGNPVGNVPVYFFIDGIPAGPWMTNSSGIASLSIGPYNSPHMANITADTSGIDPSSSNKSATTTFLIKNNLFLLRYPSAAVPINSNVSVVAVWYYNLADGIPAAGVPLKFTAYDPDQSVIGEYTGITDANGMARFDFQISSMPGTNKITVNNNMITAGPLKSVVIEGILKDVSSIVLSSSPASPIRADGETIYKLGILALDKDGDPVKYKYLTVVKMVT